MTTRKFKQIVSSIREIVLIEPLCVIKPDPEAAGFLLLDGNLRVPALKELESDGVFGLRPIPEDGVRGGAALRADGRTWSD